MTESILPDLPKRFEMVYRDSVANIMFNKRQQWVVTNYSVAACAAIVGIVRFLALPTAPAKCVLSTAALVVPVGSIYVLFVLQRRLAGHRARLQYLYPRYFSEEERRALDLGGYPRKRGFWYDLPTLVAMATVILAASAITIYLVGTSVASTS